MSQLSPCFTSIALAELLLILKGILEWIIYYMVILILRDLDIVGVDSETMAATMSSAFDYLNALLTVACSFVMPHGMSVTTRTSHLDHVLPEQLLLLL